MTISSFLPWIILLSVVAFTAWWIFRPSARTRKTDSRVIMASTLLVIMSGSFVLWQSGFRPLSQEAIDGGDEEWDNESFLSCGFCPESCIDDMSSENCSRSYLLTKCLYCAWQACDFFCYIFEKYFGLKYTMHFLNYLLLDNKQTSKKGRKCFRNE